VSAGRIWEDLVQSQLAQSQQLGTLSARFYSLINYYLDYLEYYQSITTSTIDPA
jgi:hypothetical protein